jgi:NAD(P)-dependent dehydrogenase (short-subunit alcohol dehydrogenase family)
MDIHLKHKSVLVTGASTGIGRATALHLEQIGFSVFASVRSEQDGQALCSDSAGGIVPLLMDVTDQASIERARDQVSQAVGEAGLAGLVNNAGVGFTSPLEFVPLDELRWLYEVNVFGLLAVTQAFLPLIRQAQGRLVNLSSIASIVVAPFHGPYSSTKLAVNGLSNALRLELKPHGVQVSVVVCGSIQTPIWDKGRQIAARISKRFPEQATALYGKAFRGLGEYFNRLGKTGVPPDVAARTIAHALTARRARQTYYVGPDAQLYRITEHFLYGRLRDWIIMRSTGV